MGRTSAECREIKCRVGCGVWTPCACTRGGPPLPSRSTPLLPSKADGSSPPLPHLRQLLSRLQQRRRKHILRPLQLLDHGVRPVLVAASAERCGNIIDDWFMIYESVKFSCEVLKRRSPLPLADIALASHPQVSKPPGTEAQRHSPLHRLKASTPLPSLPTCPPPPAPPSHRYLLKIELAVASMPPTALRSPAAVAATRLSTSPGSSPGHCTGRGHSKRASMLSKSKCLKPLSVP